MKVLAFDIGIKNLAYCVLDVSGTIHTIKSWENVNLLKLDADGSALAAPEKPKCHCCKAKPSWSIIRAPEEDRLYCKRHLPADRPALKDASGCVIKKIPNVADLKELLAGSGFAGKVPTKKQDILAALATKFALPFIPSAAGEARTQRRATEAALEDIHDSLRRMIQGRAEAFRGCTNVILENQPVFKNPTMKSVQMLLFATLRDHYCNLVGEGHTVPTFHLVHAGKKVKGATKGDAGYAERKDGGEARVRAWLSAAGADAAAAHWSRFFEAAPKKSDLADALCMCLDYANNKK